jgi:Uma2 family endonuclease
VARALGGRHSFKPGAVPPDLAFEVISPSDTWSASQSKRRECRENGVIQVWIDPEQGQVEVISPTHGARTFALGETAVIEELPGFEQNLFLAPPAGSES